MFNQASTKEKEFAMLSFGEVMMRLSPTGRERIGQSEMFVKNAGGAELNVVSSVARLGLRTGLITKLPDNLIGRYIRNQLRSYGVSDDYVLSDEGKHARLGLYYYESGVFPRKPQVIYDRANSSFTTITPQELPQDICHKANLFHTSGISLALADNVRETAITLMQRFKDAGAKISFDVNFRANLWSEPQARKIIEGILPMVDILFVSEETSRRMFGRTGSLEEILKSYHTHYGVSVVASTQRQIISPSKHTFGSILYSAKEDAFYSEKPYEKIDVVDRIGSGDAYVAGVLYVLLAGGDPARAVSFGNAMSAVKNTVPGDLLATDVKEIESVIADHHAVGPVSEMNR